MNPPGGDAGEYSSKDERGCDARTRRSGSVSDWRTSFPRTIFVVQTKIFYFEIKIKHKISFWLQKLSRISAIFFLPQKSLKMRDVLEKMRECGKLPNLRDFPHDCGMVDTYEMCRPFRPLSIASSHNASQSAFCGNVRHVGLTRW